MASRLRTRLRASTGLATPSLNIELATAAGGLDPRVTFSRGSNATLTDSTGKITYAPNNLLTNSESFEATTWLKGVGYNSAISANSATSPTGATDADTLVADNAGGTGAVILGRAVSVTAGISYVLSFYAKKNTLSWMQLYLLNYTTPANGGAFFDLNSGSVGTVSTGFTATTTSAGNGWYRCAIAFTAGSTVTGEMRVYLASANNSTTVNRNGTDSIYIWGAQLEQVTYQTTPGTYNSTTPKNLLGYTQEFDNAAWTKSNSFVQTNLTTYSGDASNAVWATAGAAKTSTNNADPFGTNTALLVTADGTNTNHYVQQGPAISFTSGATYTQSVWVKAGTVDRVQLTFGSPAFGSSQYANFYLSGAGSVTAAVGGTATITPYANGWYRIAFTATATATTSIQSIFVVVITSGTDGRVPSNTSSGTFLAIGAQLVQGATAGDYQPTYAAAAAVQYAAPDGTLSADKVVATSVAGGHAAQQSVTTSAPVTFSFYAKAAEYSNVAVSSNSNNYVYFNLASGVVSSSLGTGWSSATITDVGNGWYRCAASTSVANTRYDILIANGVGTNGNTAPSYTGDGTSGIYVWGAQLSNSASLDPYVYNPGAAPTSAAYYGPRFDYDPVTLAPKGLLIEEQRSNLLTYSSDITNAAWTKSNTTTTADATTAPDGTTTADKLAETATTAVHNAGQSISTTAQAYTFSCYVKAAERNFALLYHTQSNASVSVNLTTGATGTASGTVAPTSSSVTSVGNGWWRVAMTVTATAASNFFGVYVMNDLVTASYAGTAGSGIFVWGAQLEAGAFATSYIPTVASTVTRSADTASMLGTNFSSWYNANAGTIVANADTIATTGTRSIMAPSTGGNFLLYISNFNYVGEYDGTNLTLTANQTTQNTAFKAASSYGSGGMSVVLNNGTVATGSYNNAFAPIVAVFLGTNAASGALNGHIRSIQYYPTRLTNTQLQVLST